MTGLSASSRKHPTIVPLGDSAALVRFSDHLDDNSNARALALAAQLEDMPIEGAVEVVPSLVSVLVRYDSDKIGFSRLSGEIALRIGVLAPSVNAKIHPITLRFGGEAGPDLEEVASTLGMTPEAFVARHNENPMRVLTTGFAPGFVYCGFHAEDMFVPRRSAVRPKVPIGSVLFAAGQTAITATEVPTGWHVIGRTEFCNFRPEAGPPTVLAAGDFIEFYEQ